MSETEDKIMDDCDCQYCRDNPGKYVPSDDDVSVEDNPHVYDWEEVCHCPSCMNGKPCDYVQWD